MPKVLRAPAMSRCIGCYSCMLACARSTQRSFTPSQSAIQVRTAGGLQGRFVADICRACADAPCAAACPSGALTPRLGGGMTYKKKLCIGCQACVEACIVDVIYWNEVEQRPILCLFCGQCARFCPHECLEMVEVGA
jgi:Fe-S-cluster-containing dehydrogenase component